MVVSPVPAGLGAAAVTALLTPLVIRLALRTGVVDRPGPLKPHDRPVPYLGGLAVFCGVAAGSVGSRHPAVLLPLGLALVLGLLDDVTSLPVLPRLVVEMGIGTAVASATGAHGALEVAGIAAATVALVNALNMVDGIDGLALGMCAVTGLGFALVVPSGWKPFAAAVAGAAAGLLLFNRPPARVYLGDAGSYLLGTSLSVLAAASWTGSRDVPDLAVIAALLGYTWVELASTIGRRLLTRRPLFGGDRDHVYDRMERAGIGKARVTGMLVAAQAVVTALAVCVAAFDSAVIAVLLVAGLLAGTVRAALPLRPRPG
jgi:UDP-N-acetylmuramyl pentapeptide phosphotransferase/UDP-N-acetylglucosamine-1-phosphate transferase